MAGVSRFQYPTNTRTIRLLCTGQLDVRYVLEAFLRGADGVLVVGCKLGECQYFDGNYQARLKVDATKMMLKRAGMDPKRLRMEFMSAAEGGKFAETVKDFSKEIGTLGPTPVLDEKKSTQLKNSINALSEAMSRMRLRALVGKWRTVVEKGNVYGDKVDEEDWHEMIEKSIDEELTRNWILILLKEKPRSCLELAGEIGMDPAKALRGLTFLRQKNLIDVQKVEERSPIYQVI
ncbi:hydrogenase iron-sulfur subunit [candidate division TA06 bacterium]|uniref:Hydrogenase iron-sulfur subunit n=1 Tax=candidate division TA06 bacterium TaxID=2250710 RepID=A0A523UWW7_UNCT6|nr:MAG: hydrogenase iron-sulfur subunit [candidate division TA06 bacterium]